MAFWRYAKEMAGYYAAGWDTLDADQKLSLWRSGKVAMKGAFAKDVSADINDPQRPFDIGIMSIPVMQPDEDPLVSHTATPIVNGVITLVAVLVLSSFTGYIFARLKFPGKEILFYMIFSLLMIPSILTLVPQFMIVKGLGLLNTRWVLILPWTAIHQVLGIFLMRTYLEGLPGDLFESARIDGCGDFRTYWHIVLPLSKPILATLAVMKLVDLWNDLIWPSVTITDYSKQVLSVGIWALTTEFSGQYGPMFAGYVFGSLPLILVFMFGSKYYVEGLLSGALKF